MRRLCIGAVAGLMALSGSAVISAVAPSEQARIDHLIHYVETSERLVFIRNGSEYTPDEAARFLRGKLKSMGSEVTTARDFVQRIASRSSTSGEPYRVRYPDGRIVLAERFLEDELDRMRPRPG